MRREEGKGEMPGVQGAVYPATRLLHAKYTGAGSGTFPRSETFFPKFRERVRQTTKFVYKVISVMPKFFQRVTASSSRLLLL